jgi:uncharacterized protein YcbX
MEPIGTVEALWRYPVKALAAEALRAARVATSGIEGDRRGALFVHSAGHARTGKTYRGKENNALHLCDRVEDAVALAGARDLEVRLREDGPHFDAGTISVIFDTWLREAERLCGTALEPLRFRPNVYVRAASPGTGSEVDWLGRRLRIGGVELQVAAPIERCVTITYDVATAAASPDVLRTLASERGNVMGVYCDVVAAGTIARGETVLASPPAA